MTIKFDFKISVSRKKIDEKPQKAIYCNILGRSVWS